jgi:hypothetical protein
VGIDRQDEADRGDGNAPGPPADVPGQQSENNTSGIERVPGYRATVDAAYRRYAIDQGCARVEQIERDTVTPAMRRIESEDQDRHLVGLDHRLKGKDRLAEKVIAAVDEQPDLTHEHAFALIKDAIRYTFQYTDDRYTEGVYADCDRLSNEGFEPVERRNSWDHDEYKGINSRWRAPESGQLFEVQFHTQPSFEAKEETHWAYEKLRDPTTSRAEQAKMSAYQREVTTRVPVPPGATEIPDYRYP